MRSTMEKIFVILALLIFSSQQGSASKSNEGVTEFCKDEVDQLRDRIRDFAENNEKLKPLLDLWDCLDNTRVIKDMYALCDLLGNVFRNTTQFYSFKNYYIDKQAELLCDMCYNGANHLDKILNQNLEHQVNYAASKIEDPRLASFIEKHGQDLFAVITTKLFPLDLCSSMTDYCNKIPDKHPKIIDLLKGVFENATRCMECNVCDNSVLFLEMEILPNPKLPMCLVNFTREVVCDKLDALPIKGMSEMCAAAIEKQIDKILSSVKTLIHPNFICRTMLNVCNDEYGDNILACVCDTVRLPPFLNWMMPCHWKNT